MRRRRLARITGFAGFIWAIASPGWTQVVEVTGSRALGMGGAFVAVASDSSATWWNPAGLAAGPFLDVALATSAVEFSERLPAWRQKISSFAVTTPPIGFGYYRFRITDIRPFDPTGQAVAGREGRRAGVPVRSLSASQVGVTLVRTLIPGVHAGTTLKYVRGTLREGREDGLIAPSELLTRGETLDHGDADGRFDVDVGVLAVTGSLRLGVHMRNMLEPKFETAPSASQRADMRLPRQVRVGAAFDPEAATGVPLTVALDVDARRYEGVSGARRIVAVGIEHWWLAKRLGIRAGGRANTVGARRRSATGGLSVAIRRGLYVDGHAVRGGSDDEQGWGLAARVSF